MAKIDVAPEIALINEAYDKAVSELNRQIQKLNVDRYKQINGLRAKCEHKWGGWSYCYEMPRIRTCKTCGLEQED